MSTGIAFVEFLPSIITIGGGGGSVVVVVGGGDVVGAVNRSTEVKRPLSSIAIEDEKFMCKAGPPERTLR